MKSYVITIALLVTPLSTPAADLVISNNARILLTGDSFWKDGDSTAPQTGCMMPDYLIAGYALENPTKNIAGINAARSGSTMNDQISTVASMGLPFWGYQSNNFQHIGISQASENGAMNSNTMFAASSIVFQSPLLVTNGTAMTNEFGWATNSHAQWLTAGDIPGNNSTGGGTASQSNFGRQNGATNASFLVGFGGADAFNTTSNSWVVNDIVPNGGGTLFITNGAKVNHLRPAAELSWAFAFRRNTTTDTNISTATVDWNTTNPVTTNHCVISSISKNGNVLTFTRNDDRLPMAWDAPGVDPSGATITNDCTPAYTLINTNDADLFKFTIQITNLPTGLFNIVIDGVTVAVLPNTTLATGWNMFTNTVGPYWKQRSEVLGRVRDLEYANRTTLIAGNSGDGVGFPGLGSLTAGLYPTQHGDTLIAACNNYVSGLQTNTTASFTAMNAAAQPTNHTFTITLQTYQPAPFR